MKEKKLFILFFLMVLSVSAQNIFVNLRPLQRRISYHERKNNHSEVARLYEIALQQKRFKENQVIHSSAFRSYYRIGQYQNANVCLQQLDTSALNFQDRLRVFSLMAFEQEFPATTATFSFYQKHNKAFLFRDSACFRIENWEGNTSNSEYAAIPFANGLVWTSDKNRDGWYKRNNLLQKSGFSTLNYSPFSSGENSVELQSSDLLHAGPAAQLDAQHVVTNMVFDQNKNSLGIYSTRITSTGFDRVEKMVLDDFNYPITQISFSPTRTRLYFVSQVPWGYGGTDILYSDWQQGRWQRPKLLGPSINTEGNERFPYQCSNGDLVFSSDGKIGLGGMDIFFATISEDTIVRNPGFPFNSNFDDFGYAEDTLRKCAWISSNRNSKGNEDDILRVYTQKMFLHIQVYDEYHQRELEEVVLTMLDSEGNQPIAFHYDSIAHEYVAEIKPNYAYFIKAENSLYKGDSVMVVTRDSLRYAFRIHRTLIMKKRYLYYASIKLSQDGIVMPDSTFVRLLNLSSGELDSVYVKGVAYNRRLEMGCDYLLVSTIENRPYYIYIEKKPLRKGTTMAYYNMYLSAPKSSEIELESSGLDEQMHTVEVFDKVLNRSVAVNFIKNKIQFEVLDARFFEIKINQRSYSPEKIEASLGVSVKVLKK